MWVYFGAILLFFASFAMADEVAQNVVMVGEGVSMPSSTFVMFGENPAGLIYQAGPNLHIWSAALESVNPIGIQLGTGNGEVSVGAATDLTTKNLRLGCAFVYNSSWAIGLNGVQFKNPGGDHSDDIDVGLISSYKESNRIGLIVYNVFNRRSAGINRISLGYTTQMTPIARAAVDSLLFRQVEDNITYLYLTPGIKLNINQFKVSFSTRFYLGPSYEKTALGVDPTTLIGVGYFFANRQMSVQYMENYFGRQSFAFEYVF